jgi:predicted Zn-dependent protease
MAVDPKALETIKENQKTIDKIAALKKTINTFTEKAKKISTDFREHFQSKIDTTSVTDKEKLLSEADAAVKRLQVELKKQVQEELSESKRRIRAEGSRGPKRLRKTI